MDIEKEKIKDEIDLIQYNWRRMKETKSEIRKIFLKKVFKTLTFKQIEEVRIDEQMELEDLYEKLNQLREDFDVD